MTAKEKLVPELRFPEFNDEWEQKQLGEIGEVLSCRRVYERETTSFGEIPFYKISTFGEKADSYISRELYERYRENYNYPNRGDILVSASGTIGKTVIYSGEEAYFQDSNIVWLNIIKKDELSNKFLYFYYDTITWEKLEGSTIKRLYNKDLLKLEVAYPSLQEQEKIANFFNKIDKKLELQRKKIKQLKNYKKGMMQRIFNQEIRFKDEDGNEYPEWEEKRLGEIGDIYTGKTPPTKKLEYWNGEYPFITPTDITSKYINETERYLTKDGMNKSVVIPKYSLLVTSIASIGKNTINVKISSCNQQINYIKPNKYNNVEFLYYKISYIKNRLLSFAGQTATKILNKREFQNIRVKTPLFSEQKKIADLLSSLDKRIELEERKLKEFEEYKKGLMQRMFI